VEGIHTGTVHEDLQPMGRINTGEVCKELSPMRGTSCRSWGGVSSPEEEEAAETTCDELTVTPIPCPPVPLGGEEVEKRD